MRTCRLPYGCDNITINGTRNHAACAVQRRNSSAHSSKLSPMTFWSRSTLRRQVLATRLVSSHIAEIICTAGVCNAIYRRGSGINNSRSQPAKTRKVPANNPCDCILHTNTLHTHNDAGYDQIMTRQNMGAVESFRWGWSCSERSNLGYIFPTSTFVVSESFPDVDIACSHSGKPYNMRQQWAGFEITVDVTGPM